MRASHCRLLCIALVGIAILPFQPTSGETAERTTTNRAELRQLAAIKKALSSRAIKGDKKPNVPPNDRWYVLLLREEHRVSYSETHGRVLERGVRTRRSVQYLKVKGIDAAARAVLHFLTGPDSAPRLPGMPLFAGRDLLARYFITEQDADIYLATNVAAATDAGARPSRFPSLTPSSRANPPVRNAPSQLPPYSGELFGTNVVRIVNPNDFRVWVGLRSGGRGKDFIVSSRGRTTVNVPDGSYEVYFVYSNEADALYRGDDFTLRQNVVEIQIVKVVDGNYGIRRVK